jgi:hypothetical protein
MCDRELMSLSCSEEERLSLCLQSGLGTEAGSRMSGTRASARDEDRNLEGAGNLGRGQPISQLFDTLKHREQYPVRERS